MSDTFAYAKVSRSNSWDTLFSSINANFSAVNNYLNLLHDTDLVNYIEKYEPIEGQRLFKIKTTYVTGINSLSVYRNGVRLWLDTDFEEVSSNYFRLTEECHEGDEIVAVITTVGDIDKQINATVESFVAMQGQKVFNLSNVYTPNTKTVIIFKNDKLLIPGVDYEETSPIIITLKESCNYKDTLVIITNIDLNAAINRTEEMIGASEENDGLPGTVPMPTAGDNQRFLRVDGEWVSPRVFTGATENLKGEKGLVPQAKVVDRDKVLYGNGKWQNIESVAKEGESVSVTKGRDSALLKRTTAVTNGYSPLTSQKTINGSWEIATQNELLYFNYITDDNYNNENSQTVTHQIIFSPAEKKILGIITRAEVADGLTQPINLVVTGDATGEVNLSTDSNTPNNLELTINKLSSPVKIGLAGDATGFINFDGVEDKTLNVSVVNATSTIAGKMKLYNDIGNNADGTMTQAAITANLSRIYRFKGSVDTYYDLPSSGNEVGDTYSIFKANIENEINRGDNVAWNGTGWVKLAGTLDLSNYLRLTDTYVESITIENNVLRIIPSVGDPVTVNVGNDYTLPIAGSDTLGGIRVGSHLSINARGTLSVNYENAQYDENLGIMVNGLMSWEDKKKLDSIDQNTIINEITSVDGIKIGNMDVDENGVITLTDENIVNALGYVPASENKISNLSSSDLEDLITSIPVSVDPNLSTSNAYSSNAILYSELGDNTDGAVTQKAITTLLSDINTRLANLEFSGKTSIKLLSTWYQMSDIYTNYASLEEFPNSFDISGLVNASKMFHDCTSLKTLDPMSTRYLTNMSEMFLNCSHLPVAFPWIIDCSSITSVEQLANMFKGSSVTSVTFKNLKTDIRSDVNAIVLKNENTLIIEYR